MVKSKQVWPNHVIAALWAVTFFILFLEELGHIFAFQVFSTSVTWMHIRIILETLKNYQAQSLSPRY